MILGLDAKGAEITVDGDKVTVSGGSLSAEEREKLILAVGNVEGVATDEAVFHTVEKGDTLSAIAKKTLGNANRYPDLALQGVTGQSKRGIMVGAPAVSGEERHGLCIYRRYGCH